MYNDTYMLQDVDEDVTETAMPYWLLVNNTTSLKHNSISKVLT